VPPDLVDLLVTNAGVHAPSYAPRLLAEMYAPEDHDLLRAEL
jgi:translation initiation factor 2B subunit (eIF-2B alpha/beta/delta family)